MKHDLGETEYRPKMLSIKYKSSLSVKQINEESSHEYDHQTEQPRFREET